MTYRKKLIEVALPLEAINEASAREKSIRHGHPSTLHLWWARRPLAACRAVIFTSLVDDPGHHPEDDDEPNQAPAEFVEACRRLPKGKNATGFDEKGRSNDTPRMRLFDFIERLVQWEGTTDEAVLEKARELIRLATGGNPPPLLDPFAGGGSIPLEAQRLGLEAHASDLNPVAVMINKALIEIPPKFANRPPVNPRDRQKVGSKESWKGAAGLAADVRYYGEWMRDEVEKRIGHLYPKVKVSEETLSKYPILKHEGLKVNDELQIIAWLWARTVPSPNPAVKGAHVPLIKSYLLSKKSGKQYWIEPVIDLARMSYDFKINTGEGAPPKGTYESRKGGTCLLTGSPIPLEYLREAGKRGEMGFRLMAIVANGPNGRVYFPPDPEQENIAQNVGALWETEVTMPNNPRWFSPPVYGITRYVDLFTPRQLTALSTYSDLIAKVRDQIQKDALKVVPNGYEHKDTVRYSDAVVTYLAFAIDKLADLANSICPWEPVAQCPRNMFGRQAIPMQWNFAEGNPLGDSSGSWLVVIQNLERNIQATLSHVKASWSGQVRQADATSVIEHGVVISTDPPYYDNIGYADQYLRQNKVRWAVVE